MARESHVLGGLSLNDGTNYALEHFDFVPARDEDDVLTINARVRVTQRTTADLAHQAGGALVLKLGEARNLQPGGMTYVWTPHDTAVTPLTAYVLDARVTAVPIGTSGDGLGWFKRAPAYEIELTCKPGFYGAEETIAAVTSALPHFEMTLAGVKGDLPAEGRAIVTAGSSQDRGLLEWGLEQRHYDVSSGAALFTESDSMTAYGIAAGNTRAGAYDPGAAGSSVIRSGALTPTWALICAPTAGRTHVGRFRVGARVYATSVDVRLRLSAQIGTGGWRPLPGVAPPLAAGWSEVDLGVVTIPPVTAGSQRWAPMIEAMALAGTPTVDVDYMYFIPVDHGYGLIEQTAPSVVIHSGRTTEIRHDGVWREHSTGTYYGWLPSRGGSGLLIPPAGDAARAARLFVRARRLATGAVDNITDSLTVEVRYRPRYRMPRSAT